MAVKIPADHAITLLVDAFSDSALWHDSSCSWCGPRDVSLSHLQERSNAYGEIGFNLYDGTTGIALALCQAQNVHPNSGAMEIAIASISHSISRAWESASPGLYSGTAGVVAVGALVARMSGDSELRESVRELIHDKFMGGIATHDDFGASTDLISGLAGYLVGLDVVRVLEDIDVEQAAQEAITEVVARAEAGPEGVTWRDGEDTNSFGLLGIAHGNSGIAACLLPWTDLAPKLIPVIRSAVDYETHWLELNQHNGWPDLRLRLPEVASITPLPPRQTLWCHGGPGIGLSRIDLAMFLKSTTVKRDLGVAISEVVDGLSTIPAVNTPLSLCHGAAGLILIGLELGASEDVLSDSIDFLMATVPNRSLKRGPIGFTDEVPGLMTGLAGTLYFAVELAARNTDVHTLSPLTPWRWGQQLRETELLTL